MASTVPEPHSTARGLRPLWRRLSAPGRLLVAAGILLFASSGFHLVVFLLSGSPWEGPLSWRKPITFGFSFGLTAVTIALIETRLRLRAWVSWTLLGSLAALSVLETGLITLQTWRGVPSHFNFSTPFDAAVFLAMGGAVIVIGAVLTALTVLSFTSARPGAPALTWSLRAGLGLLVVGQVLGAAIIAVGTPEAIAGQREVVFGPHGVMVGAAGILKSPHAIALHAVQVLPLLGWLVYRVRWTEARRRGAVRAATFGYALVLAMSILQTVSGRAPLAPSLPLVLAAVGAVLVASLYLRVIGDLVRRPTST